MGVAVAANSKYPLLMLIFTDYKGVQVKSGEVFG